MRKPSKWVASLLAVTMFWAPISSIAEDIDIFTGGSATASNPSILFVLDNQAQWANAAQNWPDQPKQGMAEASAIKSLLNDASIVNSGVNIGLMEFNTEGSSSSNDGGFVRFPILPMTAENKAALSTELTYIYDHPTGNENESRSSGAPYGDLLRDVYGYLTSGNAVYSFASPSKPQARVDSRGYTTNYTKFKTPITQDNGCGRIFMIFIGNNSGSNSNPTNDSAANISALSSLGCSTTSIPLPNFTDIVTGGGITNLGYSQSCSTANACATTGYTACSDGTYASCACNPADFTSFAACTAGTQRYMSTKTTVTPAPTTTLGTTSDCVSSCSTADFAACSDGTSYPGGCACPSSVNTCPTGKQRYTVVETTSAGVTSLLGTTSKCKIGAATWAEAYVDFPTCIAVDNQCSQTASPTTSGPCPSGQARYLMQDVATTTSTVGATDACYSSAPAPSATSLASTCSAAGASCASPAANGTAAACAAGTQRYMVQNQHTATTTSSVGPTEVCYATGAGTTVPAAADTSLATTCSGTGTSCASPVTSTTAGACTAGTKRYMVTNAVTTTGVSTGQASICAANQTAANATLLTQIATTTSTAIGGTSTTYSNYRWNGTSSNCSPHVGGSKMYEALADRTVATNMGYSVNCVPSDSGTPSILGYTANGYNKSDSFSSAAALTCPGTYRAYNYTRTGPTTTYADKGYTLACYSSSASAATTGYTADSGDTLVIGSGSSTAALDCSGANIAAGYNAYNFTKTATTATDKGYTLSCYSSKPLADDGSKAGYTFANTATVSSTTSTGTLACPAGYRATEITNYAESAVNTTLGTTTACTAAAPTTFPDFPTCSGVGISCTATTPTTNSCPSGKATYTVQGTGVSTSTTVDLGYTNTCVASAAAASTTDVTPAATCTGSGISCAIDSTRSTTTSTASCPADSYRFMVQGTAPTTTTSAPTGTYSSTTNTYMADEWARCLNQVDVSPDGTAAVAEAFTADFNTSGAIVGADTITFDGVTTTLAGGESPAAIATAVAASTYPNWIATSSASGIVTFSNFSTGPLTDIVASDFTIFDAGATGTKPVVVVTTTTQGAAQTGGAFGKQNVTTYTLDVFNAKQNSTETALFMSMAQQGGGRYFQTKSEAQILDALKKIVSEIQSVNTAFAAASIPLSTTNRSQNLNEVYIGVFRPSLEPRWFGNLKKFKIAKTNGVLDLVDSIGTTALNSQTGFLNDCAVSFWTTDSGAWWDQVKIGAASLAANSLINPVPKSSCVAMPAANTSPWSDLPDGQSVEKGAVAEVIRRGNNPTGATTWAVNRTLYTRSGNSLVALDATNAGSTDLYNYIRGVDINEGTDHVAVAADATAVPVISAPYAGHAEEKTLSSPISNAVRASVHGDVVHSRPLAVNYGTNDTVIYYGANDGMWRAVDGLTGKEKWAFIPAEFLDTTKQTRLLQNTPYIAFGATPVAGSTPKNYLFDGSAGLFQSAVTVANPTMKVWLYPTERRGGRMVHALDVSTSATPSLKWYHGCPNLDNDTSCTASFDGIGQTWSVPVVTKIKGYSATRPVVVFGGGYDSCEDVVPNTANPQPWWACASGKGKAVYVVDAEDGTLIKTFTIGSMRGVTAGISFVDIDNDGFSDYGYVADLGGALYRLSFINSPVVPDALAAANWAIKKVAYTNGSRKFMFAPAVTYGGKVSVSGSDVYSVYVAWGSGDRERPLETDYPYASNIVNYAYGYRDTLEAYGNVAKAEVFTADFSASGTIEGADTITFDGVTTTLVGGETPADIADEVADGSYPNWNVTHTDGTAVVTFTRKTTGEQADIKATHFTIVDAVVSTDANKPVVTVAKVTDGAAAGLAACNLDGDPAAVDACFLDYTTAHASCSSPGILPTESKKAWRVGFVYRGEQAVTQTVILGGMAILNTTRPVPGAVCSAALGEGGGYFLNLINGSGAIGVSGACGGEIRGAFKGVGLPTDPVVVNLPGEDPIVIGAVSKTNTNPSTPSKLFEPNPIPPPISKVKTKKYRYTVID